MDLGSNRVILLPWPRDLECVSREDFGSKRRKSWLGFFSVCATNLQIIIHPDLPSFEESFTRAVFHAPYSTRTLSWIILVDLARRFVENLCFCVLSPARKAERSNYRVTLVREVT